jgi:hypothetical protein
MTGLPNMEEGTIDLTLLQRTSRLREQFDRAWQAALRGGPEPSIEHYVSAFPEPDRTLLRAELEKLTRDYRERRAKANELTQDEAPSGDTVEKPDRQPGPNAATCEFVADSKPASPSDNATSVLPPDTKIANSQQTAEFTPGKAPPGAESGTIDFNPKAPPRPDATHPNLGYSQRRL